MSNFTLSNWLSFVGPLLVLSGVAIQIYEYYIFSIYRDKVDNLKLYIEKIDYISSDLDQIPNEPGLITPEGLNLGETAEIMRNAAKIANKNNRENMFKQIEEIDKIKADFRKFSILAWILISLGTALQAASTLV